MQDRLHHPVEADRALAARADVAARVDVAVRVAPEAQLSRIAGGRRGMVAAPSVLCEYSRMKRAATLFEAHLKNPCQATACGQRV